MASQSLKISYVGDASQLQKTMSSIDQSHKTLASSIANVGKAIGIAFSIGAVVSFAKSSFAAFDELVAQAPNWEKSVIFEKFQNLMQAKRYPAAYALVPRMIDPLFVLW